MEKIKLLISKIFVYSEKLDKKDLNKNVVWTQDLLINLKES